MPDKMDGLSLNPQADLLALLRERAPEVFVEGRVDAEKLAATLGQAVSTDKERYGLSWAGKSECFRHIQEPTTATLRPCKGESVNFDTTENVFIEGDNLNVLKVLQKSYYGRVKMIYIDPPYNTGSDSFIYPDKFSETQDAYLRRIGDKDAEGNLIRDGFFRKNSKDAGHFHSNWLSMMYPRLFLARNLLRQEGVIFVSIDDNEVHNLRMIMNEIYGEENFVANIVWQKTYSPANDKKGIDTMHDSVLCYKKSDNFELCLLPRSEKQDSAYKNPDNDSRGAWKPIDSTRAEHRDYAYYPITTPSGKKVYPSKGRSWVFNKEDVPLLLKDNRLWFGVNGDAKPSIKRFLYEVKQGIVPTTWWPHQEVGHNDAAKKEIKTIFSGNMPFETPKPSSLIKRMVQISVPSNEGIILDFFAGSGTTAHAVMQLNAEDGGNRKFICVQLPEACDTDSEAAKAGFATIADIGRERIRRAAKKIAEDNAGKLDFDGGTLDLGFKAFRLEESNFKHWRGVFKDAAELEKELTLFVNNVREGAASEDILYELILKAGLDVNVPVEAKKKNGKTYYRLDGGRLIVCLEEKITQGLVDAMLAERPQQLITLDRAFAGNDQLKTNTALQLEAEKIEFKVI